MARIRQFKPAFFTDDKVGRLSRDARLFFFGVLSEADDEGRLVDSPKRLAGVVFPFDDDVTPKKIERWINELEAQQMVLRYQHEGGRFLYVRRFKNHQKMSHPTPSTLPPPPSGPGQSSGAAPEKGRSDTGEPPADFVPVFEGVSVSEGVGVSENGSSSKLSLVGDADPEEEDHSRESWDGLLAARLIAKRRCEKLTNPPPEGFRRNAWLKTTVERLLAEDEELIREHLAAGLPVESVVDLFEPPARPPTAAPLPYPAAGAQPPPTYDEVLVDGEWKLVDHRVGA